MKDPTDNLSPVARRLLKLHAGSAYEKLVIPEGAGNREALADLTSTDGRGLCAGTVTDHNEAACMHAGLYLWHDYLHDAHEICQSIDTPSGSFWHAILHRREGDFSNAKYWYRMATANGPHPAMEAIAQNAALMLQDEPADTALLKLFTPGFSGNALVDLCQAVYRNERHPHARIARSMQQLEWRVLFEFNAARAQVG